MAEIVDNLKAKFPPTPAAFPLPPKQTASPRPMRSSRGAMRIPVNWAKGDIVKHPDGMVGRVARTFDDDDKLVAKGGRSHRLIMIEWADGKPHQSDTWGNAFFERIGQPISSTLGPLAPVLQSTNRDPSMREEAARREQIAMDAIGIDVRTVEPRDAEGQNIVQGQVIAFAHPRSRHLLYGVVENVDAGTAQGKIVGNNGGKAFTLNQRADVGVFFMVDTMSNGPIIMKPAPAKRSKARHVHEGGYSSDPETRSSRRGHMDRVTDALGETLGREQLDGLRATLRTVGDFPPPRPDRRKTQTPERVEVPPPPAIDRTSASRIGELRSDVVDDSARDTSRATARRRLRTAAAKVKAARAAVRELKEKRDETNKYKSRTFTNDGASSPDAQFEVILKLNESMKKRAVMDELKQSVGNPWHQDGVYGEWVFKSNYAEDSAAELRDAPAREGIQYKPLELTQMTTMAANERDIQYSATISEPNNRLDIFLYMKESLRGNVPEIINHFLAFAKTIEKENLQIQLHFY